MATKTSGGTRIGANVRCKRGRKRWDMRLRFGPGDWRWLSTGMTTQRAAEAVREVEQTRIERGEAGLLDPFDATRATPLADLVATYCQVLQALNRAPRHVASVRDRLSFAFDAMGARFVQDADLPKIEAFLGKVVRGEGLPPMRARSAKGKPIPRRPVSLRTRDGYVEVLRAFGNWMHEGGRWGSNPFGKVRTEASGSPPTMEHRAFDVDEIDALVGAAEVRCVQQWVRGGKDGGGHANADATKLAALAAEGWARGTLYLFASYAALRWNECRTLCWGDLVLDGPEPYVLVRAKNAKNRKTGQQVPLVDFLVERLQQHRKRQAEAAVRGGGRVPDRSSPVFTMRRGLLAALRKDACWAELGEHDAHGRRTTFHGLRASGDTLLWRAGVALAVAVLIMRHADPKLTIQTYAKLDALRDGHRELRKLQRPRSAGAPPQVPTRTEPMAAAAGCSSALAEAGSRIAEAVQTGDSPLARGSTRFLATASHSDGKPGEWWALQESNL